MTGGPQIDERTFRFRYKNYRGERSARRILPSHVWFGATEYHPAPQWILTGYDFDKGALRDFALADISPLEA